MEHFLKDEPESSYQKLLVRDSRGGGVDELSSTRHRTSTCQETIDRVLGRTEKAVN